MKMKNLYQMRLLEENGQVKKFNERNWKFYKRTGYWTWWRPETFSVVFGMKKAVLGDFKKTFRPSPWTWHPHALFR